MYVPRGMLWIARMTQLRCPWKVYMYTTLQCGITTPVIGFIEDNTSVSLWIWPIRRTWLIHTSHESHVQNHSVLSSARRFVVRHMCNTICTNMRASTSVHTMTRVQLIFSRFCACGTCDICMSHVQNMGQIDNDASVLFAINPIQPVVYLENFD